ncbi:nuclear transport factor 2 family protein [Amycolatopsis echigonensis]|uniref:Nuclear transport factor 2 family protein n=1 Tax=Amycolatopsis echigonensis TaxID=2576905 RepID=A0A8E2B7L0_9PSEU|nr:nuclear transport factor 2 family protein [Amycolatopsis echigonensis]MBB2504884.1 nuclear transport factor 2 family protein [Amycolatopsis echigonensis]
MGNDALVDKIAIEQLIHRYNRLTDEEDFEGWASCFAPDGVFHGAYEDFRAHADLDKFAEHARALIAKMPNLRHFVTNIECEVNGDTASVQSYLLMTSTSPSGESSIVMVGRSEDELVKIDGNWLFSSRTTRLDGADAAGDRS